MTMDCFLFLHEWLCLNLFHLLKILSLSFVYVHCLVMLWGQASTALFSIFLNCHDYSFFIKLTGFSKFP